MMYCGILRLIDCPLFLTFPEGSLRDVVVREVDLCPAFVSVRVVSRAEGGVSLPYPGTWVCACVRVRGGRTYEHARVRALTWGRGRWRSRWPRPCACAARRIRPRPAPPPAPASATPCGGRAGPAGPSPAPGAGRCSSAGTQERPVIPHARAPPHRFKPERGCRAQRAKFPRLTLESHASKGQR